MSRPDLPTYLLRLAREAATRSTCPRRAVGCVLADVKGHVLSTGYNGVPSGAPHCYEERHELTTRLTIAPAFVVDVTCPGRNEAPGRTDLCRAIHAEQNAVAHCLGLREVHFAVCTTEPCNSCLKLLLAIPAKVLIIGERYPGSGSIDLWRAYGRDVVEFYDRSLGDR